VPQQGAEVGPGKIANRSVAHSSDLLTEFTTVTDREKCLRVEAEAFVAWLAIMFSCVVVGVQSKRVKTAPLPRG